MYQTETSLKTTQLGQTGMEITRVGFGAWALGGGFFGRIGDRIGRSRALVLTIMTYAMFTGSEGASVIKVALILGIVGCVVGLKVISH